MIHRLARIGLWTFSAALTAFGPAAPAAHAAELTVSAAASLQNAFREIAVAWEGAHPGDRVLLNFAASGTLLQQIVQGAPVDVFASADEDTMDRAAERGQIDAATRRGFAANALVVVVPAGAAQTPAALADLQAPHVQRIAVGDPRSVPAGRYTQRALQAAPAGAAGGNAWDALEAKWIRAQSVRQVLDYVARDEVNAGFVYATDAALMKERVRIAFPVELKEPVRYPVAVLRHAPQPALAASFVEFLLAPAGQEILARYGFAPPVPAGN